MDALKERQSARDYVAPVTEIVVRKRFGFDDLWIQTKNGALVRFEPNPIQEEYLDEFAPGWRITGIPKLQGLREIPLKARQEGISTLVAVVYFLLTINEGSQKTVVMSYNDQGSTDLFDMVRRFYRHMPISDRPRTERANAGELVFPDLDSSYIVKTAGSTLSGRGSTVHNLHLSEMAFWKYPAVLPAIIESVGPTGNIFLESTANGEGSRTPQRKISGNMFCVYWREASSGEMPEYTARFFAWHRNPEYTLVANPDGGWLVPFTDTRLPAFRLTDDRDEAADNRLFKRYGNETAIKLTYALTDGQMAWRRMKIDGPGGDMFAQEYPANADEAFSISGHRFFGDFDEDKHVRPAAGFVIPPHWQPFGSKDFGFASPCSFHLHWVTDYLVNGQPAIVTTDELYAVGKTNREQAAAELEILRRRGLAGRYVPIYADPAGWAKTGRAQADNIGRADVEDFHEAGLAYIKANNNRPHGWSNIKHYLRDVDKDKGPAWFCLDNCEHLIRTIPLQKQAQKKQAGADGKLLEDLDTNLEDHACFVEGTLIETSTGRVPIECVAVGDLVWTRRGLRPVSQSGLTSKAAVVVTVHTSAGPLTCTPNHPIFSNEQWTNADSLGYYDNILVYRGLECQQNEDRVKVRSKWSASAALITSAIQKRTISAIAAIMPAVPPSAHLESVTSTALYGSILMAPFLMAVRSITGMKTLRITPYQTWNASLKKSITRPTSPKRGASLQGATSTKYALWPQLGTVPMLASSGTRNMQLTSISDVESAFQRTANSAVNRSKPLRTGIMTSVLTPVNPLGVGLLALMTSLLFAWSARLSSLRADTRKPRLAVGHVVGVDPGGLADVYNLSVEGVHEYFANGVLVHNCDDWRYGMNSRPRKSTLPDSPLDLTYGLGGGVITGDPHAFDRERWPEPLRGPDREEESANDW